MVSFESNDGFRVMMDRFDKDAKRRRNATPAIAYEASGFLNKIDPIGQTGIKNTEPFFPGIQHQAGKAVKNFHRQALTL